ncbi:hypothetical protein HanRHA438_Chr01g0033521 [Helianthus annuus]|nr:hypothetical protein HanRHA438_Chr01g0033521 [Helianthus annuus]
MNKPSGSNIMFIIFILRIIIRIRRSRRNTEEVPNADHETT